MSEPDSFRWQLSLKLGTGNAHMLNVRSDSAETFAVALEDLAKLAPTIREAVKTFDPVSAPAPYPIADVRAAPPAAPALAPAQAPGQGQEVGPVMLEKIEPTQGLIKKGPRTGQPYTRWAIVLSGGIRASTFDALIGDIAGKLLGKMVYATVEKGDYGYELIALRPA